MLSFDWDRKKDLENRKKHGIPFGIAQFAFADPDRIIAEDLEHSKHEKRYFCFGQVQGGVLTVRFTIRRRVVRIIGAGYWRKGRSIYEKENKIRG